MLYLKAQKSILLITSDRDKVPTGPKNLIGKLKFILALVIVLALFPIVF